MEEDRLEQYLAYPRHVTIEASSRCNFLCPLCLWTQNRNHGHLRVETFARFIDEARHFVKRLCFSGRGEPTLNPDLYALLKKSVEAGVLTDLATNGSHLHRDLDQILDCGVDYVNVSIEADNPEDYSRYRVRGDFHAVVSGMERLAREKQRRGLKKPGLRTVTVLFNFNEDRLEKLKAFFAGLGFEGFIFKSAHLGHGLLPEGEEVLRERWLPADPHKQRPRYRGAGPGLCSFLSKAHLLWNGDVCRCAIDHEEMVVGNIRHELFARIWKGPKSRAVVRRIVDGRFSKCAACAFSGRELIEKDDELLVL